MTPSAKIEALSKAPPENKFIISKRKANLMLGGLWELPGVKKNNKESYEDCLHREFQEELKKYNAKDNES